MKTNEQLHLSSAGLSLLKASEGFRNRVYKDSAGFLTIGFGHLLTAGEIATHIFDSGLTQEHAETLLHVDILKAEAGVKSRVQVKLTQGQFDALVDFTFNFGGQKLSESTLLKKLNLGNYKAVPAELLKWCKARDEKTGQLMTLSGLLHRREQEVELWKRPDPA